MIKKPSSSEFMKNKSVALLNDLDLKIILDSTVHVLTVL